MNCDSNSSRSGKELSEIVRGDGRTGTASSRWVDAGRERCSSGDIRKRWISTMYEGASQGVQREYAKESVRVE